MINSRYIYPIIESNVMIGSGAVIIENGTVGDNCAVGTNAAVFKDVPKEATVVGVLARIVKCLEG